MMMRFLHLADVHLDTPFSGRAAGVRRRLRDAVREAFRRGVDLALDEELDAVLIAGDLFDGETFSFETERYLLEELRRLTARGVTVVYATGNHDPGSDPGRRRALEWPAGVHVAAGPEPVRAPVHDRQGRLVGHVTAVGHATPSETRDLARHFPRPPGMLPEVAVLHAQVVSSKGADEHGRYAPTTVETLRRRGYDYWALGHVHRRQEVAAEPAIHYPGNVQGRTPAEAGPRGGLLVELAGGAPRVVFRSLAPVRWETIDVGGLGEVGSLDALVRVVAGAWRAWLEDEAGSRAEWMLRVRLVGGCPLWHMLRDAEERTTLEQALAAELEVLDVAVDAGAVHAPVDPDEHRERPDALGWALRGLEALRDAGTPDLDRIQGELAGWEAHRESLDAYLRRILRGADADLVSRMLRSD